MPSNAPLVLELAGFRLEVRRREFPDSTDYWDGNWLLVACECKSLDASVRADGPFVHLSEVHELRTKLEALQSGGSKNEIINFIEPELGMSFEAFAPEKFRFEVRLIPSQRDQLQPFSFDIDLSSTLDAIRQCNAILEAYPIRDGAAE